MIKKVNVVVAEGQCVSTVAIAMEQKGCQIEAILEDIGVITGSIDASELDSIKNISGVASVEEVTDTQ